MLAWAVTSCRFFEENGAELPPWLLMVDLNRRSVVADEPDGGLGSIFERQLQALLRPEFWQPCAQCALRSRCFIKFNADTLGDPDLRPGGARAATRPVRDRAPAPAAPHHHARSSLCPVMADLPGPQL